MAPTNQDSNDSDKESRGGSRDPQDEQLTYDVGGMNRALTQMGP